MKKYVIAVVAALALSACGQFKGNDGDVGATGPQGPTGPAATPAPTPSPADANAADIADVLENGAHGNKYRLGLGQTELSSGLSCQVQHVSAGQCLSNASNGSPACVGQPTLTMTGSNYTYLYSGSFSQPNAANGVNNLIPTPLQQMFVGTNYRIVCTGQIVVQQPGWYSFEDVSDDGSIVYLDGATLYNDGNHAVNAVPVTQSVYFDRDVHSIQIWYAQSGGGNFGLVLTSGGQPIPSNVMFH
jgi:hypothetical protein